MKDLAETWSLIFPGVSAFLTSFINDGIMIYRQNTVTLIEILLLLILPL